MRCAEAGQRSLILRMEAPPGDGLQLVANGPDQTATGLRKPRGLVAKARIWPLVTEVGRLLLELCYLRSYRTHALGLLQMQQFDHFTVDANGALARVLRLRKSSNDSLCPIELLGTR